MLSTDSLELHVALTHLAATTGAKSVRWCPTQPASSWFGYGSMYVCRKRGHNAVQRERVTDYHTYDRQFDYWVICRVDPTKPSEGNGWQPWRFPRHAEEVFRRWVEQFARERRLVNPHVYVDIETRSVFYHTYGRLVGPL
jgi:hypothetical protein